MFSVFEKDKISINMLASGFCKPLAMLLSYIYIPIALDYLGVEKYGVWVTIMTIISWIGYFDIGIGNGLRNRLTESISSGDMHLLRKFVSSAYILIFIIIVLFNICFLVVSMFLDWNSIFGVAFIDEDLRSLILFCCLLISFNFLLSLSHNIIFAYQKAGFVSFAQLCTQLFNLLGVLVLRNNSVSNIKNIATVYCLSLVVVNFTVSLIVFLAHPEIAPRIRDFDYTAGKKLTHLGLRFFVIQLCALVLYSTDSFIISICYGASDVTPYSTVINVFMAIANIFIAFLNPVWSSVTKLKTLNKTYEIKKYLRLFLFILIPFLIITVFLALIFEPFSLIWLHKELNYTNTLIFLGMIYGIFVMWTNLFAVILNGMEVVDIPMFLAIIESIINIPLSLFFAIICKMNSSGVLLGTVLTLLIPTLVQPFLLNRELKGTIKG